MNSEIEDSEIEEIRRALGLSDDVPIEAVGRVELPGPRRTRGAAAAVARAEEGESTVAPEPERLAALFHERSFGFSPLEVPGLPPDVGQVTGVDDLPGLFLLRASGRVSVRSGRWDGFDDDDRLALDARPAPVVVRIEDDRAVHVLRLTDSRVVAVRVLDRDDALLEAFSRVRAAPKRGATIPAVPEAVAAVSGPDWLRAAVVELLASDHPIDRAVAVGLVLRLWTPADDEETRRLVAADRGAVATPSHVAAAWARSVPDDARADLVRAARDRLAEVAESLDRLGDLVIAEAAAAEDVAAHALRRRDDVESILALLRAARDRTRAAALAEDAARIDEDAARRLSAFASIALPELDERLHAVAWQEPDAWWGALPGLPR